MDTKWKRCNSGSPAQMLAFLGVLLTNPVLAVYVLDLVGRQQSLPETLLLFVSCGLCLALTAFLFVRTGRVSGSDEIRLGESGHLPTEALVSALVLTPLLGLALALSLWHTDVVVVGLATFGGGIMLACLLALARKWKAGRLLADSALARAWPAVRRALRFAGRALRGILTGENFLNVRYPAGRAWVYRILWVCGAMAALVALSYLVLSNQLLGVGSEKWFGAGRYTAFAMFAILVVASGAGYLIWRSYFDARDFDALLAQLDVAATGEPAPVCVKEGSGLRAASEAVAAIGTHLQESVVAQMKSERMKLDLITNVSHDLKTPLTSIIGYLDLLEKQKDLPAEAQDYVHILRRKSERLAATVSDLFTLAKATSGSETLDIEPLDLVMAVRQTLGDMEDIVTHAGIPVRRRMPESALVEADSAKLYRVLQNILDNALRYSLPGTRIYLEVERGQDATRLVLTNTAAYEMTFAAQDVLQRFVRGDISRTTEGSGLGLSIAQTFMQNFGGSLDVEVRGDAFVVTLAFRNAQRPEPSRPGWEQDPSPAMCRDADGELLDMPEEMPPAGPDTSGRQSDACEQGDIPAAPDGTDGPDSAGEEMPPAGPDTSGRQSDACEQGDIPAAPDGTDGPDSAGEEAPPAAPGRTDGPDSAGEKAPPAAPGRTDGPDSAGEKTPPAGQSPGCGHRDKFFSEQ